MSYSDQEHEQEQEVASAWCISRIAYYLPC